MESRSSERERDEASIEILRKLREQLLSEDISTARIAGLNLSWKQEDGLTILSEVLFGEYPRTAKKAAAYGLRSMKGRMRKIALEVLEQGLRHRDHTTKSACAKSLLLIKGGVSGKGGIEIKSKPGKGKTERSSTSRV